MPLRILRLRMLMGSSLVRGLLVTGMFSAFFLGSLYLERVLGYDAIQTGPRVHAADARDRRRCRSASRRKLVERFGIVQTLAGGLARDHRRAAAARRRRASHASYFPGLFIAVPAARARRRRLVPAAADDRHVRRAAARRRARLGHRQRLGAAVRRDRPGDARHDRHRPHEVAGGERRQLAERAHRRLPPRLRGGRRRASRSGSSRRCWCCAARSSRRCRRRAAASWS